MGSARAKFPARHVLIFTLFVSSTCIYTPTATAQAPDIEPQPIRVESNEVLVPVLVFDKKRLDAIHQMNIVDFLRQASAQNSRLLDDVAVQGLSATDFHMFEDGNEQHIQRVTTEPGAPWKLTWTTNGSRPDPAAPKGPGDAVTVHWLSYVVAYTPPPSPDGSCHQIMVKVDRSDSVVFARQEYCNVSHAANDTLKGTQLGSQMEADLNSSRSGNLKLSLMIFPAFGDAKGGYRTDVIVESPAKPRWLADCTKPPKIGVLGILYTSNRLIAARFSGLIGDVIPVAVPTPPSGDKSCVQTGPDDYGTRLDLTPGQYILRVVVRDGKKFGRSETPVNLGSYVGKSLEISEVVLAKRHRQIQGSSDGATTSAGEYVPLAVRGFEVLPAMNSRFKKGEPLGFYFEIYALQQAATPPTTIEAHLRIVNATTGQVVKTLQPVDAAHYATPGDPVIPIGGEIDISALPSDKYRLDVQATDSAGTDTLWRTANFTIGH